MRTAETLTWIVIAWAALGYMSTVKAAQITKALPLPPSAQNEVDPTRWRHYGDQPVDWGDWRGNANRVDDPEALALRKALAF